MRGLVFFNMHHVIFGLTAYIKKLIFISLVNAEATDRYAKPTPGGSKTLSTIKKKGRVTDTR